MTDRQKLLPTSRLVTAIHFISVDSFQDVYQRTSLFHMFPGSCTWSLCVAALLYNKLLFFFLLLICLICYTISPFSVVFTKCSVQSRRLRSLFPHRTNGESMGGSSVTFPVLLPSRFLIWAGQFEKRSFSPCPCSGWCLLRLLQNNSSALVFAFWNASIHFKYSLT